MALHVTTEVGKSGRAERQRRHFPERRGEEEEYTRGRLYISPSEGIQPEWKPHSQSIKVEYSERGGLDWDSRVKFIGAFKEPEPRSEVTIPRRRYYPGRLNQTTKEWSSYPEGFHIGRRCQFTLNKTDKPVHQAGRTTTKEITHSMLYGKNRKIYTELQRRDNFPAASPGDKSYQVVEYSPNFHMYGSTRPVVNFGGSSRSKPDTFVPLQALPSIPCEPYRSKDRRRKYIEEVNLVQCLEEWRPATPLVPPVVMDDGRKLLAAAAT
ncbi:spermatogenesis-associated serine-rich protein 1-like [Amphiura filiformis]|uniref:spermatogenesis-associated serine-rich protein 1-like n=1 Tax=Amphiura filiformis TaxID=82378 RepID=UPI003B228864